MQTEKRPHEWGTAVITYHAPDRTFDRLFKEESLQETKEAVRRKLGLPSDAIIQLKQLRGGETIDLDDDDDFEALHVSATFGSSIDVRVTVVPEQSTVTKRKRRLSSAGHADAPQTIASSPPVRDADETSQMVKNLKRKRRHSSAGYTITPPSILAPTAVPDASALDSDDDTTSQVVRAEQMVPVPTAKRKRRNSLAGHTDISRIQAFPVVHDPGEPCPGGDSTKNPVASPSKRKKRHSTAGLTGIPGTAPILPAVQGAVALDSDGEKEKNRVTAPSIGGRKRKVSFALDMTSGTHRASILKKHKVDLMDIPTSDISNGSTPPPYPSSNPTSLADLTPDLHAKRHSRKNLVSKSSEKSIRTLETQEQAKGKKNSKSSMSLSQSVESGSSSSSVFESPSDPIDSNVCDGGSLYDTEDLPPQITVNENRTQPSVTMQSGQADTSMDAFQNTQQVSKRKKAKNQKSVVDNTIPESSLGIKPPSNKASVAITNAEHSKHSTSAFPSSNSFASQLVGAIAKSSEIARSYMQMATTDQNIKSSKKRTTKRTTTSDTVVASSSTSREAAPRTHRQSELDDPNADMHQIEESSQGEPLLKGLDYFRGNATSSDSPPGHEGEALVRAAMLRVLEKNKPLESTAPNITGLCRNADSTGKITKANNKLKKAKSPVKTPSGPEESQQSAVQDQPLVNSDKPSVRPHLEFKSPTMSKSTTSITPKSPTASRQDQIPCFLCLQVPFHPFSQCPTVKKRVRQLKKGNDVRQTQLIKEVERMIAAQSNAASNGQNLDVNSKSTVLSSVSVTDIPQNLTNAPDDLPDKSLNDMTASSFNKHNMPDSRSSHSKPANLPKLDAIFDNRDESSSDDATEDDTDEDGDHLAGKGPSEKSKRPTAISMPSYASIDLDALIRGPSTHRLSVDDILSEPLNDEDPEEVVLEEEDDSTFRRLTKRLERASSPSSDDRDLNMGDDDDDGGSPPPLPPIRAGSFTDGERVLGDVGGYPSFQDIDKPGESLEIDRTGDAAFSAALADDDVAMKSQMNGHGNIESTSESSVNNGFLLEPLRSDDQAKSASLSVAHEREVNFVGTHEANADHRSLHPTGLDAGTPAPSAPSTTTTVVIEGDQAVAGDDDSHPLITESHPSDYVSRPSFSIDNSSQEPDEDDPIEPADDLLERPVENPSESQKAGNTTPSESRAEGHTKIRKRSAAGTRRMTKLGIHETEGMVVSPPNNTDPPKPAPRTRAATRAASKSISLPEIPTRRGRSLRSTGERGAKKSVEKDEKARRTTNKVPGDVPTKIGDVKAGMKTRSTHSIDHSPASPLLIDQWTTLRPSSSVDRESSPLVDQLQPSSPNQAAIVPNRANGARNGKTQQLSDPGEDKDNQHGSKEAAPSDPLFIPSESQESFPYSRRNDNPRKECHANSQDTIVHAVSTSESEVEVEELTTRTPARTPTFRSLIDIAKQKTLFSDRPLTPASFSSRSQTNDRKTVDLYGGDSDEDDDDDDDDDDDSGPDTEKEKSHIPKGRRAGVQVRITRAR